MNYWFELRYTLRLLRKKQGFAAICAFVIAVGIGISIPLATVSGFFGFTEVPLPDNKRLFIVRQQIEGQGNVPFIDPFSYRRLEQTTTSFDFLAAFRQHAAVFSDGETAESFFGAWITPQFMEYGADTPLLGRTLVSSDDFPGAEPVAVIGYNLWQTYYGGDTDIIGRVSEINGESTTIVGVMPQGFGFPIAHELWLPLQLSNIPEAGSARNLYVSGLLKEGVEPSDAATELNIIFASLADEYPEFYATSKASVLPYSLILINDGPVFGYLFMSMIVTVLLLVCFNVANLLTARNSERINELAVRGAVGGSRWRITSQVLMESFLICLFASIIGLLLGSIGVSIIGAGFANSVLRVPFWLEFSITANDLLFVALITAGIWLLSGLYPAWKISRQDINTVLSSDSSSVTGHASSRFTKIMVTIEIVVSCFLLVVCLSTVAGYYASTRQDMGVTPDGLLTARINLSSSGYAEADSKLRFLEDLRTELATNDEFGEVTFASALAGQTTPRLNFELEDLTRTADSNLPQVGLAWLDANYLNVMGVELLQGRFFDASDDATSGAVAIIDELFAQRYWPGESAIGKRIRVQPEQGGDWVTIVGVINHIIQGQPTAERLYQSTLYRPIKQLAALDSGPMSISTISMTVASRATDSTPIIDLEQSLKSAAARVDREIPLSDVYAMSEMMYLSVRSNSFFYNIMLWMAIATVVLAIVGVYGVVSRSVLSRAMEIGIRRALGSSSTNILSIFLKQGSLYLAVGLLLGGIGGVVTVGVLLQAVGSDQGMSIVFTYIVPPVSVVLCTMVLAASYFPARKLIAIEPGEALHYE